MNDPGPPFPRLVQAVLEGTATGAQRAQLAECLHRDPARRAEYVRQLRLDALLRFRGGAPAEAATPPRAVATVRRGWWQGWGALAAAALVLLGSVALWWERRGVEVEVVRSGGGAAAEWHAGSSVRLRQLKLVDGQVEFLLPSGVWLETVAPAELRFIDPMHVRVVRGQVTIDVGRRGKGFVVDTAQTRVVDLGTKFGVAVANPGHTDVVVFEGEVELFDRPARRPPGAPRTRLTEGEAVRIDARRQLNRIVNVNSGPRAEGWTTGDNGTGSVIASVHDNLREPSARHFYRIVAGGLQEDAPAFVAKRHEWNGLDAGGIPAELVGADLVQTFPGDRLNMELEIVVAVARPAVVYVLADSRTPPPPWLAARFTDTGARIGLENAPLLTSGRTSGRGPGVGNMAPFAVWKHVLPEGGAVTLGPPGIAAPDTPQWMYGIAARTL